MSEENKPMDTTIVSSQKIVERASQEIVDEAKRMALQTINPEEWKLILSMSEVFWKAGAIPQSFKNSYQVAMALQAGAEVGLKPVFSLNSISFINGRASIYGEAAIALIISKGHKIKWGACNEFEATVTITRGDTGDSMVGHFTMDMAIKRGLTKTRDGKSKDAWITSPDNLLKFKAFHSVAKFLVPDALHDMDVVGGDEEESRVINKTDHSINNNKKKDDQIIEGETIDTRARLAQALEKPIEILDNQKTPTTLKAENFEVPTKQDKIIEVLPPKKKDETPAVKRMREAAEKAKIEEKSIE